VGVSSLTVEVALEMRNLGYSPVACGKEELRQRRVERQTKKSKFSIFPVSHK
jgi:hypothetical protein